MGKIGRNDPCPCGSGEKFKRCCIAKAPAEGKPASSSEASPPGISLQAEVDKTREDALARRATLRNLGVFIFFTTQTGDGWLLELSDMDALKLAEAGEALPVEIVENSETIEVNWTHRFSVKGGAFTTKTYKENRTEVHAAYPGKRLKSVVERCRGRFPKELLDRVHVA